MNGMRKCMIVNALLSIVWFGTLIWAYGYFYGTGYYARVDFNLSDIAFILYHFIVLIVAVSLAHKDEVSTLALVFATILSFALALLFGIITLIVWLEGNLAFSDDKVRLVIAVGMVVLSVLMSVLYLVVIIKKQIMYRKRRKLPKEKVQFYKIP